MENDRIVREVRGDVNRRVNCEAANITKTVNAATRQIEDIEYLRDNGILDGLPGNLKEMAIIRLDNPDATLPELGKLFDPPLGKSGVNHRLRKLSEIAEDHRISG
jgi:DNA-binding protein WhiA